MTRGLIAFALLLTGWISFLCDIVQLRIGGLAVAGVALILLALYLLDVFTRAFWTRTTTIPRSKK